MFLQARVTQWVPFICALLAISCVHAPAQFTFKDIEQQYAPPPQSGDLLLTAKQVTHDVDLLLYALDRGYAGKDFVPPADWSRLKQKLTSLRGHSMKVSEFCDQVGDALWQVPDAHLGAKRIEPKVEKPIRCGQLREQNDRQGTVGNNYSFADKEHNWAVEFLSKGNMTIAVMSIKSFPDHGDPVWAEFDKTVARLLEGDAFIIDMRGNGGGDDTRGYQLAETLIDGDVWGGAGIAAHFRETPETLTLRKNMFDRDGRRKDGTLSEHMQAAYTKVSTERDEAVVGKRAEYRVVTVPPPQVVLGPRAFQGAIAILVDEDCKSSCESSLFVLRQHPKAKVFGARTAGYVHFGNGGLLGLPESGISVLIPTKYNEFPSGKFYDKVGFEPDVLVPSGNNAFDVAIHWLQEIGPAKKIAQ